MTNSSRLVRLGLNRKGPILFILLQANIKVKKVMISAVKNAMDGITKVMKESIVRANILLVAKVY